MLKLTYTHSGVTLERTVESLEAALRRRVFLGLRMGQSLGLEPTSASLLINGSLPALKALSTAIAESSTNALRLIRRSAAQVEMQLQGYWLASQQGSGEGVFYASNLDPVLESHLLNVWQMSQQDLSCLS
jgi:hypothetical protein